MCLRHHAVPLAPFQGVVPRSKRGVLRERRDGLVGEGIGARVVLCGQASVPGHCVIEVVEVGEGEHRVLDQLEVRRLLLWPQPGFHREHALHQRIPLADDGSKLAAIQSAITLLAQRKASGIQQLRLAPRRELAVAGEQLSNGLGLCRTERRLRPSLRIFGQRLRRHRGRAPGLGHEEAQRELQRLDVAHVDDPQLARAALPGQVHLLPGLLDLRGVDPLVVARPTDIVEVVVHAEPTGPLQAGGRQAADLAPVVVGKQQGHVVGHGHAVVIVVLHFLVQRPHLRRVLRRAAGDLGDDAPLVGHHRLQQGDRRALAHRLVAVATHADGDQAVETAPILLRLRPRHHPLDAAAPKGTKLVAVARVVPGAAGDAVIGVAVPFVVRARHRLVVRGAHHHAHLVGQHRVSRVVVVEGMRRPHGRPQGVALEAQQQVEHMRVHLRVEAAEFRLRPGAEGRRLVVDEEAAVLHRWLVLAAASGDVDRVAPRYRRVGEPIPGRDADLFRQVIQAEHGAAPVRTDDDQGPRHAGEWLLDHGLAEAFPGALQPGHIQFPLPHERIDGRAVAEHADDDGWSLCLHL